ncbi:DNA (cytosine-5)-methyltransferase 3C-like isoform X2 [Corticium candelabrum]|uniref:DNA (cytosine-5)-methyltransferase 3C-like isoform X2 n=1 Tax=Corticium candelabrum TaxID=121492 RepID=UPI002E2602E1|nr:DNA (cytosine-5)-methyltransferase 3C-like isoform X2 [Corticium candelabrum]
MQAATSPNEGAGPMRVRKKRQRDHKTRREGQEEVCDLSAKVGKREEEAGGENDESDGNVVSESVDINGGASVFPEQLTASEAGGGVVDGDRSDTLQCAVSDQKDGKRISLVASDGSNDVQMKVDDTNELHSSKSSKKTKRLSKTLANRTETQVLDRNLTDTQEMVAMVAIAIGGDNSNGLAEDDVHGSLEMRRPGLRVKRAKTYVKEKVMCEELEEEKRAREDEAAAVAASLEEEKSRIRKLAKKRQRIVLEVGLGEIVWGKLQGFDWWPAKVTGYWEAFQDPPAHGSVWLKWYGDETYSQLPALVDRMAPFGHFKEKFNFLKLRQMQYRRSLLAAIEEAARRAQKDFSDERDPDSVVLIDINTSTSSVENGDTDKSPLKQTPKKKYDFARILPALKDIEKLLFQWALNGFLPSGPNGFKPSPDDIAESDRSLLQHQNATNSATVPSGIVSTPSRSKKPILPTGVRSVEFQMSRSNGTSSSPMAASKAVDVRKKAISKEQQDRLIQVRSGKIKVEDLCLGCGSMQLATKHPLFIGGLCAFCKDSFLENCYLFDEDGTQMYCTICSDGMEVYLCDSQGCARAYCGLCIEKLCGKEELDKVKDVDSWICYMCKPETCSGLLKIQPDWQHQLQAIFQSGTQLEFEPFPPCKPIPLVERKPISVLGLFDGIATGLMVLKDLGFEIDKYVASEVDLEAVKVTRVHHRDIVHVGDIRQITEVWIQEHGPFDLVMGGSPCNDLSVANPFRKGVYEGTGRLFFEFYRLLSYARPSSHDEPRPFFWLFENVVSMRAEDRDTISRFLQCNPLVLDARDISPANRARYFWGNLPGMNRPAVPRPTDKLTLQECLEPNCNRVAQVHKIRTVTTKANSIKQTRKMLFPVQDIDEVTHEEKGDVLWCTELERAFGFPEHYTDVANMGRVHRQRLLGRAWSVPVIRHLFSPLRDYFKCKFEGTAP